eukprot:CAMPEP_0114346142 /NCGR_PEP_ID=MMETSP0101-20121206/12827_1 /TAXON_ID=38822 ORGANISM="Pteridomonas danica, Strain PT" /NCGR_SAMPLE_ID=MMETSP0101 /ASSEMBLY_ACC=CAM_ASM_000211 /LENGTH=106 /DNA_ID=CAMNT_0001482601 /DNA_START=12 /DNA_END=329 /DNA_ORIENTATION=-
MAIIGAIMTGYLFISNLLFRCFNKIWLQREGELYLVDQNQFKEPCAELLKKMSMMRKLKKMKARYLNKKNYKKNQITKQQKVVLEKKTQEMNEIKDLNKSSSELIW